MLKNFVHERHENYEKKAVQIGNTIARQFEDFPACVKIPELPALLFYLS